MFLAARVPGLDATDLRRAQDGLPVARTLEGGDAREVVAIGAIALPVSRQAVVASLRDIMFTRSTAVPQLGRFGATPSAADLDTLTIDATDLGDLRECTPAGCKIHLPADTVRTLERLDRDGSSAAADERRARLFKQFVAERARAYLDRGRSSLDCHVIHISRARMKATAGRFGGITRRIIESRARDALRRFLETLKTRSARLPRES